jgi:hypothetical protein
MEFLIFGFASLATLVLFGAVSLLPAALAFYIGRYFRNRYLRWVFAGLAIAVPASWACASYYTFTDGCKTLPRQEFVPPPKDQPDSVRISARHVNAEDLIERGMFSFVEKDFSDIIVRRFSAGQKEYPHSPIPVVRDSIPIAEAKSAYIVTETTERRLDRWWKPPIVLLGLEIKEIRSGRRLAKATDLVFGGGILGPYLQLLGGDQDFERLSCGYASPDVGAWRPTLSSRRRFAQYKDADAAFLSRALKANLGK